MSKMFQVYGIGQALIPVLPPPLPFQTPPVSTQTNYEIGQIVFTPPQAPTAFYMYGGAGNWINFASNSGDIIAINGTANQITASTTSGTTTLSLPTTLTAPGSITAASGNITATNGNFVFTAAGSKEIHTSVGTTTAAGANSIGTVTLASGTATVATTAVNASSIIRLTRMGIGSTGAAALGILTVGTISAGTSFVITSVQAANATAAQTTDVSVVAWEIIN